jgi:hypothetical protein
VNGGFISDKIDDLKKADTNGLNGTSKLNGNGNFTNGDKNANQEHQFIDLLNKPPTINVVGPLWKTFWKEFIVVALFRLVALCIQFVNPLILDILLTYISSNG